MNKVSRTFNCMVTETPQDMTSEGKGWLVTVDGEAFGGSYAMKLLFVPDVVASKMTKGQRYALVLQQQIVRNRQDGTPHDGEKDWMYFWRVERFAEPGDTIPQTPVPAASEAPATASWSSTASIDERIAWNSAINNANEATKPPENVHDALLEALEEVVNDIESYCDDWNSDSPTDVTVVLPKLRVAIAIAKTRGEVEDDAQWIENIVRRATLLYPAIRKGYTPPEEGVYDESAQQLSDGITGESPF